MSHVIFVNDPIFGQLPGDALDQIAAGYEVPEIDIDTEEHHEQTLKRSQSMPLLTQEKTDKVVRSKLISRE